MNSHLPSYQRAQVLIVGDIILDRYWRGRSNRISPEAPVPVVNMERVEDRPGGAANVAVNVAALGAKASLVGITGADDAAVTLREILLAKNIDPHLFVDVTGSTLIKIRVIASNQQMIRIDFEANFQQIDSKPLLELIERNLSPQPGVVVLSDYGKGTLSAVQEIIQMGRRANLPVLVDPKGTDFERYRGATLVTPNLAEFEAVVGRCRNDQDLVERGFQLIDKYQFSALLVTRSEKGMTLIQQGHPPLHMPARALEVYDVSGAGDTVIAVIAASLAAGSTIESACNLANTAAGLVVGKLGTSTTSVAELQRALANHFTDGFGVVSETELKEAILRSRARGERIVMTNGCFDTLHAEHVFRLEEARQLGDRLIVAVSADQFTDSIEGRMRANNPLETRMQVLAALKAVDWVVALGEDTTQRLIHEILPDHLVDGLERLSTDISDSGGVLASDPIKGPRRFGG